MAPFVGWFTSSFTGDFPPLSSITGGFFGGFNGISWSFHGTIWTIYLWSQNLEESDHLLGELAYNQLHMIVGCIRKTGGIWNLPARDCHFNLLVPIFFSQPKKHRRWNWGKEWVEEESGWRGRITKIYFCCGYHLLTGAFYAGLLDGLLGVGWWTW